MPHTVNLFYELIISCVKLALKDSATILETHNVSLIKNWELFSVMAAVLINRNCYYYIIITIYFSFIHSFLCYRIYCLMPLDL